MEQVNDHIVSQIFNQLFEILERLDGINHIMMDELGQLSLKIIVMELYQICRTKTVHVFMCLMAKK